MWNCLPSKKPVCSEGHEYGNTGEKPACSGGLNPHKDSYNNPNEFPPLFRTLNNSLIKLDLKLKNLNILD